MAALQQSESLLVKLTNYKANQQKFQCLFALHPIIGPNGEYKYQIGLQLDFVLGPQITAQLLEMDRLLRFLPHSITGEDAEDILRILPTDYLGDGTIFPFVNIDPSTTSAAQTNQPAASGFGGGFGGSVPTSFGNTGGAFGTPAHVVVAAPINNQANEIMAQGKEVVTKKGKGKDQYGRSFGKKQKAAMLEFTKTLWLQDATASLKNLMQYEVAQQAFMAFLKTEYGEAQLEFFLESQKLERMDANSQASAALQIYGMFITAPGKGIGQQERTVATQKLWDNANNSSAQQVDPMTALNAIRKEAETTLNMLSFDAFPRFIKSKYAGAVIEAMKQQGSGAQIEGIMSAANSKAPQDADDWLNMFVSTAEAMPACIVISDMTIPGAPMVFVNSEFSRTTGYAKEEATGRNCRFLQGPETEPEAIQVIRNTLSKGQDCHVKLTNYRKNGEKFQNLLSMKPVFDADGIYRFVIGVQFEITEDSNLKQRLVQLDKLLRLLPSKLNLRSKASARAKGAMAVKTSGEANNLIGNKEAILQQAKQAEIAELSNGSSRPKQLVTVSNYDTKSLNYDRTLAAFTKITWLHDPMNACRALLMDPMGREYFIKYAEGSCSLLIQTHLQFFSECMDIRSATGASQVKKIRLAHMKKTKNVMFYCATTEIEYGTLNQLNWGPIFENICL